MKYQLSHLTEYAYQHTVANSYNVTCLTPRTLSYQHVHNNSLQVYPLGAQKTEYLDFFGNLRQFFHLQPPHQQLSVISKATVTVLPRHNAARLANGATLDELQQYLQQQNSPDAIMAKLFCQPSQLAPHSTETATLLTPLLAREESVLNIVERLNQYIFQEFTYTPGFSTVVTPLSEVIKHRRGVCQDFAQLAISCLRSHGIPARYVSGYLETQPAAGQTKLQGADASHAWFAVFDPKLGWIDFDPTNNLLPCEKHLTVAFGRDYADVVPLKGLVQGSGNHKLTVAVDVERYG